jgi:predicted transcriptional regulator YdeE
MPDVVVKTWESIWKMSPVELGGKRRYAADFEIYDERAADHQNIVLDVFVGIE